MVINKKIFCNNELSSCYSIKRITVQICSRFLAHPVNHQPYWSRKSKKQIVKVSIKTHISTYQVQLTIYTYQRELSNIVSRVSVCERAPNALNGRVISMRVREIPVVLEPWLGSHPAQPLINFRSAQIVAPYVFLPSIHWNTIWWIID